MPVHLLVLIVHMHMFSLCVLCLFHAGTPPLEAAKIIVVIGWSNNHFNDLHFRISLETKETTTGAADETLMFCDF